MPKLNWSSEDRFRVYPFTGRSVGSVNWNGGPGASLGGRGLRVARTVEVAGRGG